MEGRKGYPPHQEIKTTSELRKDVLIENEGREISMRCNRCPLEDRCSELKKLCNVKESGCPLELAIAFVLIAANAFGKKK